MEISLTDNKPVLLGLDQPEPESILDREGPALQMELPPEQEVPPIFTGGRQQRHLLHAYVDEADVPAAPVGMPLDEFLALPKVGEKPDPGAGMSPEEFLALPKVDLAAIADQKMNLQDFGELKRSEFDAWRKREKQKTFGQKSGEVVRGVQTGSGTMIANIIKTGIGAADVVGLNDKLVDTFLAIGADDAALAVDSLTQEVRQDPNVKLGGAEFMASTMEGLGKYWNGQADFGLGLKDFAGVQIAKLTNSEEAVEDLRFEKVKAELLRKQQTTAQPGETYVGAWSVAFEQVFGDPTNAELVELQRGLDELVNPVIAEGMAIAPDILVGAGLGKLIASVPRAATTSTLGAKAAVQMGASSASIGRKVDSVLRNTAKSVRDKTVRLRDGAPAVNGAKAVAPLGERLGGFAKTTADLGATVGGVASGNFPLALAGRAVGPVAGFTVKTGTNVGLWGLKHGYRATRGTAGLVRNTLSPFALIAKSKLEYGVGAANRVTYARIAADKTQPAWTRAVAGQAEYISRSKSARIIGAGTGAGLIEAMQEGLTESAMLTSTPSRVGEGIGGAGIIGGGVGLAGGALATRSIDDHFADLDALHYRESMVERGDDPTLFDDLPQSARRDLAAMQGVLGDTADIRLASGAEFAKATNQAPGEAGQQGVFLTDAGEVIINMDTIGSDPNTLLSTVSHEIGHAAYKSLPDSVKDQWRDIAHYQFGDAVVEQFRTDYSESLGQEVTTDVALDEMFAEYFLGVNSTGRKLLKGKVALGTLDAGANRAIRRITDTVRRKMGIEGADIDPNTQLFEFTPYKANPEVERFVQDSLKELGSPLPKVPMPDPATTVDPDDPGVSALQQALDAEAGGVITLPNGKAVYPVRAEGDKVSYVDADEATNRIQESEETPDSDDVRVREGLANAREGKGPFTDLVQEAPVGAFADPADPVEAGQLAAAQAAAANENLGPNTRAQAQTDVDRITQDKAVTPPPPAAYTPVDPLTAAEAFKETIDRNIELGGLEMVPFQYEGDAGIQERELLPFGVTVSKEGDPSIRGYDAAAVRADLQENGAPEGFDSIRDFRETSTLAATNPGAITPEKRSALFKAVRPHTRNFLFDKVRGIGVESAGKSSTTGVSSNNINEPTRTRPRAFSSTRGQTRKTSVDPGDIVSSYERARSTQEDSDPFLDDGSAEFDPASSAARARQLQDLKRETPKATPEILRRAKAAKTSGLGGFEHDVHAEKGADRVVKVWKHALGDGEMPIQYIKRHQVFNRDFDMGSRIEGYDRNGGIISSSPFFDAENADLPHPTPADVDIYMRQKGYRQTAPDEYRKGSTTVTDVKPENFIQTSEGPQLIDALVETDDITSQVYQNESDPFGDDPFGDDPFANDFGDDNLFSPNRGTTNDPTQANDPAGALRLAQGDSTQAGGLRDTGGVRRGEDRVQAPYSPYVQTPKEPPLAGLPATVEVDGRLVTFGPLEAARQAAIDYTTAAGIPYTPIRTYAKVNRERATRIANAFDQMEHNPSDPAVQESYQAMADETLAQYEAVKASGLVIEPMPPGAPDPYGNPRNAVLDVVENNHMWFYPTSEGFGGPASADVNISGNPLMDYTGEVINGHPMQVNDVFRVVHDYFGHVKEGLGFRAGGEENAWRSHSAMYSDKARPAMTTETRGQNSWVNYGPFAEANRTANGADTEYAPQKVGLLPEEFVTDGAGDSFSPNRGSTNDTNDITGRTEDVGQLGVGDGGVLPAAGDLGTGARPTPSPPRPGTPEFLAGKPITGRAPALIEADIDAAEEIYKRVGPDSGITTGITGVRDPLRAVHWSKAKAPTNLDPKVAGGAPGAEGKRQKNNPALFEPRTYFGDNDYAQNPEALVTSRAKSRVDFEIDRDKLFEPGDAPEVVAAAKEIAARIEGPQAPAETYIESALKATGYEGVYDPATRAGYLFNEVGLENASVSQDLSPGVRTEGGALFSATRGDARDALDQLTSDIRENVEEYDSDIIQEIYDANPADLEEAFPVLDSPYFGDPATFRGNVYHQTPKENIQGIIDEGIGARNLTRGINNRGTGASVFAAAEPDESGTYGDHTVEINVGALRDAQDIQTSLEEPVAEVYRQQALARHLGEGPDQFELDTSSGESESTLVIDGGVPRDFIQVTDPDGEVMFTGDAFNGGILFSVPRGEGEISAALPTAKKPLEIPTDAPIEAHRVGIGKIDYAAHTLGDKTAQKTTKALVGLINKVAGFGDIKSDGTSQGNVKALETARDRIVNNLLAVYDAVAPPIQNFWQRWYPLAREWNEVQGNRVNVPHWVIAGVNARLSPGKDWIHNVNMTERILGVMAENPTLDDVVWNKAVDVLTTAKLNSLKGTKAKAAKANPEPVRAEVEAKFTKDFGDVRGKTFSEMSDLQAGLFARYYTQAKGDNTVTDYFHPEQPLYSNGISWQSGVNLAGAVNILRNPTLENMSAQLGKAHKIRSFANNQINPTEAVYQDVTMDTHAAGAAFILPVAQKSPEVGDNFGGHTNSALGSVGSYPVLADGYRIAAEKRGVTPAAMQSVTWEGVRNLFPPRFKSAKNLEAIRELWRQTETGEKTQVQVIQEINSMVQDFLSRNPQGKGHYPMVLRPPVE